MIKYPGKFHSREDFCVVIVDDTHRYSGITKEYVKNQADYTIQNCVGMNFDVYVTRDEEHTLTQLDYEKAVVISAGTEFLHGEDFFDSIKGDYYLLGHLLDMGDAYFHLHEQCYVINLKMLDTEIGQTEHCTYNRQVIPVKSDENIHDDYTPLWIDTGYKFYNYRHKLHGWKVISHGINNGHKMYAFNEKQRNSKNYIYPNGTGIDYLHKRYHYSITDLVYKENTGSDNLPDRARNCLVAVLPASGNMYEYIGRPDTHYKFFDHSPKAIEYIKEKTSHLSAEYHVIDVIANTEDFIEMIGFNGGLTYIEMSNVFCFECTTPFYSTEYRKQKEQKIIEFADNIGAMVHFDQRAGDLNLLPYWHY